MDRVADYVFLRELGRGEHSQVYLARTPRRLGIDTDTVAVFSFASLDLSARVLWFRAWLVRAFVADPCKSALDQSLMPAMTKVGASSNFISPELAETEPRDSGAVSGFGFSTKRILLRSRERIRASSTADESSNPDFVA